MPAMSQRSAEARDWLTDVGPEVVGPEVTQRCYESEGTDRPAIRARISSTLMS